MVISGKKLLYVIGDRLNEERTGKEQRVESDSCVKCRCVECKYLLKRMIVLYQNICFLRNNSVTSNAEVLLIFPWSLN